MPRALPNRFRFTDLALARLKPPTTGEVICWDTLLVGLGCRVSKTGRKTWCVAIGGGKRRLGTFPEMSVADARAGARKLMAGGVVSRPGPVFHTIVDDFLRHGRTRKGRELRANTINQYRRVFNAYCKPLYNCDIGTISRRDIAELLRRVANESGAPTASLVRSMLARLWSYAIETGEVEYNVVTGTPSYEIAKRSRTLTDGEIGALWAAASFSSFRQMEDSAKTDDFALILRLLLWTGCRRSEAGGARWSELGCQQLLTTIWTIPGSRTKNHRDLILPLPKQAVDALAQWPRVLGRDCLFGVHSSAGYNNWALAKRRLDARIQFSRPWCIHDIRRTVQSRLAGLAVPHPVINRILNHAFDPVTEAYDRYDYQPEMKSALQLWADKLEEIITTSQPEVIALKSRKRS